MPKPSFKGAAKQSVKGWGAVITGGILLTVLALADGPRSSSHAVTTADGSTGCQVQVTAAQLKVRTSPNVDAVSTETLTQGTVVDGTTEITDGFRKLKGDRWAANEFLVPVAGTSC